MVEDKDNFEPFVDINEEDLEKVTDNDFEPFVDIKEEDLEKVLDNDFEPCFDKEWISEDEVYEDLDYGDWEEEDWNDVVDLTLTENDYFEEIFDGKDFDESSDENDNNEKK